MIQIGSTITTLRTQLSCQVMIGYAIDPKSSFKHRDFWWLKVWGRLPIGPEAGDWGYAGKGIILVRTALGESPVFGTPGNTLVFLEDVPERFAERITPANGLSGKGRLLQTNEEVNWEMWYPTRPIPR
jgi:hypothetical protein